jgi:hypothetical protein
LRSGLRAFTLADPAFGLLFALLAAGFRDFVLAGDLRRGFAGFLAMVILTIRVPNALELGAIGKTSNYIICLFVAGAFLGDVRRTATNHVELPQPFRFLGRERGFDRRPGSPGALRLLPIAGNPSAQVHGGVLRGDPVVLGGGERRRQDRLNR